MSVGAGSRVRPSSPGPGSLVGRVKVASSGSVGIGGRAPLQEVRAPPRASEAGKKPIDGQAGRGRGGKGGDEAGSAPPGPPLSPASHLRRRPWRVACPCAGRRTQSKRPAPSGRHVSLHSWLRRAGCRGPPSRQVGHRELSATPGNGSTGSVTAVPPVPPLEPLRLSS